MKETEEHITQEEFDRTLIVGCVELFLGIAGIIIACHFLPFILR
jgi:hypothetical protein